MPNIYLAYMDIISIKKNENGKFVPILNEDALSDAIMTIIDKGLKILVIAFLMLLSIKIGNKIINKFVEKQAESKLSFSMDTQKAKTIGEVLKSVLKYAVYFLGIALMLSDMFSGISVAVASVGGFAIGFGAQSLVKDLINGFFVLFEDQYGVGDHVTIGQYTGIIESIGIRTTIIRDFTGDLHLIPNGSIMEITNHSRGDIRFIVDFEIAYEEDVDTTITLVENRIKRFQEEHNEVLRGKIEILGVNSLNASGVTIRVIGRSKPLHQWEMERMLRKAIKEVLDENNIEIPYPKTQLINK